ncbi:hypothetical protein NUSPORA_01541 [Nucleospora cyclopteri]
MKQKFSVLDVRAISKEFNDILTNKYIQNIYSTGQKSFYFKLNTKEVVLIDPGHKAYMTDSYDTEINHFCKKLRPLLRNLRIIGVKQFGFDRIIVFDLLKYKMVVEFYSMGNILILDKDDVILEVHRPVEQLTVVKGQKYIWNEIKLEINVEEAIKNQECFYKEMPFEKDFVDLTFTSFVEKFGDNFSEIKLNEEIITFFDEVLKKVENMGWKGEVVIKDRKPLNFTAFITQKASELKNDQEHLKELLSEVKLSANIKYPLQDVKEIFSLVNTKNSVIHFSSLNHAVRFFYNFECKIKKKKSKENGEIPKNERIQKAQQRYMGELEMQAESVQEQIYMVENNKKLVEEVLNIFTKVYSNKMSWSMFEHFYEEEKKQGNEVANAIITYNLKEKQVFIVINEETVELDASINLNKNIQKLYKKKKKFLEKRKKTGEAMEKIESKMKPTKVGVKTQTRELYWFEKFNFFISEDQCLIIGGRNAQQNEMIVKKYMENNDLYFHCIVKGGSSVVCKKSSEINIRDASYVALCMSKCWEEQVMKDVFYVNPDQVSKTAPTGEFVPKGGFIIKGKKTEVHPYRLEYGIAIIFKLKNAIDILDFSECPSEDDEIEHAMPISGPWVALKKYKYAVRIVPGNERKQKVAMEIYKRFDEQEKNITINLKIRAIGLQEYINIIPGKSRIAKS